MWPNILNSLENQRMEFVCIVKSFLDLFYIEDISSSIWSPMSCLGQEIANYLISHFPFLLQDSYLGDDFQLKSQADQVLSQDSSYQGDRGGYHPFSSQAEYSQPMYNSQYWSQNVAQLTRSLESPRKGNSERKMRKSVNMGWFLRQADSAYLIRCNAALHQNHVSSRLVIFKFYRCILETPNNIEADRQAIVYLVH